MPDKLPPQVFIARASAGSGKTHALAKRYIQLLINSLPSHQNFWCEGAHRKEAPLKEVLAITFTNKAALEMKQRILEFLKKLALDAFLDEHEKRDILSLLEPKSAGKDALFVMDQIILNYHFFQVQTIDSFIKSILSGCAFKTGLSSSFWIKEDYKENLAYSLDKLIDKAQTDRKVMGIFVIFLKQYLYVETRLNWFLKKDILSLLETMFYLSNIYGVKFRKCDKSSAGIIAEKRNVIRLMKRLRDNAPEGIRQTSLNSLNSFLEENKDGFDIDGIPPLFDGPDLPLKKGYALTEKIEKLFQDIRVRLRDICEIESASLFNPYIDIFAMAMDVFKEEANREDILFLEELNRCAKVLFDDASMSVGELYYRLATRLRHYLIDEFQDTSWLQWRNLSAMVEEALSSGGTLFCVGDRKQAIYRFRGGDSSLLDYVKDRFERFNVKDECLNMNFRSHREIVLFNNEVFSKENLTRFIEASGRFNPIEKEAIVAGFQGSAQAYKGENPFGYVRIERIDVRDREERESIIKEKIVSLVGELCKRFSPQDMAILTRDNDEAELVTEWLLQKGVPVESDKTLNIKEHPRIKELISFLMFLNSPIDNLSFSSFILGDIFTGAAGIPREEMEDFIFGMRKTGGGYFYPHTKDFGVGVYRQFRERYREAWENLIEGFFKSVGFVPLYEFVITILQRFSVMERFPGEQGFFMRFLELIKEQEDANASIALFLEFFDRHEGDDLYVDIVSSKYARVLTIHKSKGLEFPVVIIPFLDLDVRIGITAKREGGSFAVYAGEEGLELRRLKKRYGSFSEILDALYREEYKRSFIDELNNTYVAFTRAKNELYIFIPEKSAGRNLAGLLVPGTGCRTEFGREVSYPDAGKKAGACAAEAKMIPVSRYEEWLPLLKDEFIDISRLKNRRRILKGEILHYILSFIGNLMSARKEAVIKNAIAAGRVRFPFAGGMEEFASIVERIIKDKKLSPFFFVEDGSVYQEKEFVDRYGVTHRIDRLIVREKSAEIIDYKSSKDDIEAYHRQIGKYKDVLKNLYPEKAIKGFLVFLDDFTVEEV